MIDNSTIGYVLEGLFAGLGVVVLFRTWLLPLVRKSEPVYRLPARNQFTADTIFAFAALLAPMTLASVSALYGSKLVPTWSLNTIQLAATYVQEIAMIAVIVGYYYFQKHGRLTEIGGEASPPAVKLPALSTGILTFLAGMPLIFLVAGLWQGALTLCGYPVAHQTIVELFLGFDTPGMQVLFGIVAVVLVPFTEEMIFRAGLFRGLRANLPRAYAIGISAVIFGAAHMDLTSFLPLVALGVVLAVAYERTGNIGTVIVAHALFNLNTLVALLLGVNA